MISKPKNYDSLKTGYESITPGGHKCVVKEVIETVSEWDVTQEVVKISFDTSIEDTQPQFFTNAWMSDTRSDKKWRGVKTYTKSSEYFDGQISKFIGALEASNPDVDFWKNGVLDLAACKDKKIGIVFRGEDYTKQDHTVGYTVKPFFFCDYEKALEQDIPARKPISQAQASISQMPVQQAFPQTPPPAQAAPPFQGQQTAGPNYGFVAVPDGLEDEGLPFN